MAETAVFHLLANLAPFLQGEVNLLSGVREAMEDIRDEFERMSAFLIVADATEERDPELKVWVKQVRDAAYDTEYVLDKFKLHLAQHHGDGFGGFLRKSFYFPKTLKARHQIASEIQRYSERSSRLRSLFVWGPMDSLPNASLRELFRHGSRLLNVLDLSGIPLDTIPNEVFKLIHLRYLGLTNTKVKMVPKLIGKLENLETLDLGRTYVTELPDEILHLQKLRNLISFHRIPTTANLKLRDLCGFKSPSQIGRLQYLQVLTLIEADQNSEGGISIAKELGRLTQLRELSIGNLRREDGVILCSSIEKLSNLRKLCVMSTKEDEILDLQSLSPVPRFLQELYLDGRLEKFPRWIPSLRGLFVLTLGWSKLRDDPLQSLQELPNLAKLVFEQTCEGEVLCFKAGGFQRLKRLRLSNLKGLRWVRVEEGAMPHLEALIIRGSELMEEVPSGIQHLTHVQTFELGDMSEKLISKLNREVQDENYRKIAHIPEVIYWYWEHGQWKVKFL
ncbi:disease resistance protein RPM1-like [Camellia sinensis]|uniref:Uncharacterized protein n=1 Tax=Camellia sinensis var. sinensis TaxID=542762 RepID=A0A4S4E5U0_CAMSN|nr:disease resistance protein RPM1-like [Camellia sinensis]THG10904.1 hypothetical protein TEA_015786 [Camellia sinensis var. sinensis]